MNNVAIIGAGISGLTVAHLLRDRDDRVTVFEKESTPGGLIRCKRVDGSLYHLCGGHVFNSKRQDVLNWFWNIFNKEEEFTQTDRNSVVCITPENVVPYPIENHIYLFDEDIQKSFIDDILHISQIPNVKVNNFEEFLQHRFGETLYELYFKPYNEKIWRRNLQQVPLTWLEGKLPMPTVAEMIYNNMNHVKEKQFVHSSFWYEKVGGSQYIADKLAAGLDIRYNADIAEITKTDVGWVVNGETFDLVFFCGNIKSLPKMLKGVDFSSYVKAINALEYHGTTSVFCEIEKNPYSWIYLPSTEYESHRIICTGNFSNSNNAEGKFTATVEFTDEITLEDILINLSRTPFAPKYITHHYNQYTYPIQDSNTRGIIQQLKTILAPYNFYFTGRFADWEYYNMDVAMGAAMDTVALLRF